MSVSKALQCFVCSFINLIKRCVRSLYPPMTLLLGLLTHVVAYMRTPIADIYNVKCSRIAARGSRLAPRSRNPRPLRAREDAPRGYLTLWYSLPQDNDRAWKTVFNRVRGGKETTGPERTPATTCWSQVKCTHLVASVGTYSIHN